METAFHTLSCLLNASSLSVQFNPICGSIFIALVNDGGGNDLGSPVLSGAHGPHPFDQCLRNGARTKGYSCRARGEGLGLRRTCAAASRWKVKTVGGRSGRGRRERPQAVGTLTDRASWVRLVSSAGLTPHSHYRSIPFTTFRRVHPGDPYDLNDLRRRHERFLQEDHHLLPHHLSAFPYVF